MGFIKNFLMNAGMMVTIAYVANIIYKYALIRFSARTKYISSIFLLIFAGWASCFFGFRLSENVIFDLRFLPLIVAAAVYSRPIVIMLIGIGIGLTRLTFGLDTAAFVGVLNLTILGVVCAVENQVYVVTTGTVGSLPTVDFMRGNFGQAAVITPNDIPFPPRGILVEGEINDDMIVTADLDLELLYQVREKGSVTTWRDRRTDLYTDWS